MSGKGLDTLLGRNRSSAFHTGDDYALGNVRQSIFQIQCACCAAECTDARTVIISDSLLIQNIHLFPDSTVNTRISCVKSYCCLACSLCFFHYGKYFFQGHFGTVVNSADVLGALKKLGIYQGSGIDYHICFL